MDQCKKCGGSDFRSSGICRPCAKAYAHAWHVANPEKAKAARLVKYAKEKGDRSPLGVEASARKKLHQASRYMENTEKFSKASREQYEKNRTAIAAKYAANSEKMRADSRAWQKANPDAVRIIKQNRRTREGGDRLSKGLVQKLWTLQRGLCPCCSQPLGDDYHLDHLMPLALGGSNTDDNIQLLRSTCNQQKHAKHPISFMQERGFLL